MTTNDKRKHLLMEFLRRIWNDGDAEAAVDYLAATYTIHHDPGDPWDGQMLDLAGFRDRLVRSRAAFPDQRFDVQRAFAEDDAVAITWLWSATHRGDLPGFPATHQPIRLSGASVYLFDEEDRLTGHWQVTDRLGVYQQLQRQAAGRSD